MKKKKNKLLVLKITENGTTVFHGCKDPFFCTVKTEKKNGQMGESLCYSGNIVETVLII
jgi:hypothetical protein